MLKYGVICEINYSEGWARVNFDELGIVSGKLSLPASCNKSNKENIPIEINTQVAVLMHKDGEQGEILKAVYNESDTPPSWADEFTHGKEFSDGTIITYNTNTHKLSVQLCSGGTIETNGKNQVLDAIMEIINGAPIPEPGNGSSSAFQTALKAAITYKNEGIWENG